MEGCPKVYFGLPPLVICPVAMKRFVITLVSLVICISCFAQTDSYKEFADAAAGRMAIYRGRVGTGYTFKYNGTFYFEDSEFVRGDILYDGRLYCAVLLNLNSHKQELLVKLTEGSPALVVKESLVKHFTIGDRCFVNLVAYGYKDAPEGYLEIQRSPEGEQIYMLRNKVLDINNYTSETIKNTFITKDSFWKIVDGRAVKFKLKKKDRTIPVAVSEVVWPELESRPVTVVASSPLPVSSRSRSPQLPSLYFEDRRSIDDDSILRKYLESLQTEVTMQNKVYEVGDRAGSTGGYAYVSGYVRDAVSGEPIAGVLVQSGNKSSLYSSTDAYGFYKLRLPVGDDNLNYSGYGLEDVNLSVVVNSDGNLNLEMKEKVTALKGAVISSEASARHRDAMMGVENVRIDIISKASVSLGEADIIKTVLTLPGVKSSGEASVGFYVRGGTADQNLILFNDGTIYNPSHMFGIFSAFNADVVSDVQLYKSSIPVEFGGRISSVMDVHTRDGNSKKLTGSVGLGLLTSHAHIEGPLGKKTTFILGGRTTYSNWILNLLPKNTSEYSGGAANFHDVNLGVSHKVNDRNSLHVYGYYSGDKFRFRNDTTFNYSNVNASLKWRSVLNERSTMTLSAGYDQYGNQLTQGQEYYVSTLTTSIRQVFAKLNLKSVTESGHTLQYGGDVIAYSLDPGHTDPYGPKSHAVSRALPVQTALEPALYIGDAWRISEKFSLDGGVRYSGFKNLDGKKFYHAPELRASGKYSFRENLSIKAGFNSMRQYIHLISNTTNISPMDTWTLCTDKIKPQDGWQAAGGFYWTINDGAFDISAEGYYKRMSNYLDYKSGAVLSMNPNLVESLVLTRGKSYGAELMVRKNGGKLTGWLSYTYSRALLKEMENRGIETINGGDWYNAPQDKPHDLKIVGNYKFTHRYSFSFDMDYSTGKPITIPIGIYSYGGGQKIAYSARNGYRIPDYFRLDLAFNIEPGHYLKAFTHMSLTFGVYNVTGRKNAYSVYFTSDGNRITGHMLTVFGSQIPYINLNLKF